MAIVRLDAPLLGILWHISVGHDSYPKSLHCMVLTRAMRHGQCHKQSRQLLLAFLQKIPVMVPYDVAFGQGYRCRRKVPNAWEKDFTHLVTLTPDSQAVERPQCAIVTRRPRQRIAF